MPDRAVIVTGSEGVIGRVLAAQLERSGRWRVVRLDLTLGHDLTDEAQVRALMAEHREATSLVNLFALNDHVEEGKSNPTLFDLSLEAVRRFCEVNLVALFSVCRQFAAHCRKPAAIVNLSSLYGVRSPKHFIYDGSEKHVGYTITKHGVVGLTRHLATYLAPDVRVNCLVPGGVEHEQAATFKASYARHVPLGRMMRAEDLAGVIELLCSDAGSYVTGAVIPVDGGWTAW